MSGLFVLGEEYSTITIIDSSVADGATKPFKFLLHSMQNSK
jgi:hypothetical protein